MPFPLIIYTFIKLRYVSKQSEIRKHMYILIFKKYINNV